MRRRELGVIMKSCVAALSAAVVLTAMPAQVNAAPTKSVTVSTQASLNKALKNSKVGTINIKTSVKRSFSIPKGKFTNKSVVITAPKASLTNSGSLKGLYLKSAAAVTEKADNNKIGITDKSLKLTVAKGADNSKIYIGTTGAKVTVVANGKVAALGISKKATVALTGTTTKPVSVINDASGTGLVVSTKANVSLKQPTTVSVKKGADIGTVTAYKNATVNVAKGAKVATLNSTGDKASVKVDADGTVGKVVLKKKATLAITGDTTKPVAVTNNASGSVVKLAVKADVNATQPTTVNAYKGAEVGKVVATKNVAVNVQTGAKVNTVTATKDVSVTVAKGAEVGTITGSKDVAVAVAVGAKVDAVKSQGEEAKVTVTANGTVGDVVIDGKAEVTVEGTTTKPVNVTSNAADSLVIVNATSNITLNEKASVTVAEGAKVESLTATKDVALNVSTGAEVAEVVVKGTDAKVDVTANGTVGAVTIDAKAEVSIKGETDKPVVVNANVEDTKINTKVKTEVNANANVDITLKEGAEGSKVVSGENTNSTVTNNTKEDVTVTDSNGKENTVESGKTEETEETKPVVPETPSLGPVGPSLPEINLEVTKSIDTDIVEVDSTLQLTATVNEPYKNYKVYWESSNESIATVDEKGKVSVKGDALTSSKNNAEIVGITATVGSKSVQIILTVVPKNTVALLSNQGIKIAFSNGTADDANKGQVLLNAVTKAHEIAKSESITIRLLDNVDMENNQIAFNNKDCFITLDLNGHTLTGNVRGSLIKIGCGQFLEGAAGATYDSSKFVGAKLEITDDSSNGKRGTIVNNTNDTAVIQLFVFSELTLDGGVNIKHENAEASVAHAVIKVYGDERGEGAAHDKSTKLDVNKAKIFNTGYGICYFGGCTINIYDGAEIVSDTEEGCYAAIGGNGSNYSNCWEGDTIVNIYEGSIINGGTKNAGIFHPEQGQLNIFGGTISGLTGVDIKAGTLTMKRGEIKTTDSSKKPHLNDETQGVMGEGYAIAVVEHSSYHSVMVNIDGGKIDGPVMIERKTDASAKGYKYAINMKSGILTSGEPRYGSTFDDVSDTSNRYTITVNDTTVNLPTSSTVSENQSESGSSQSEQG